MRIGSVIIIVWLIIGAIAAGQRHYYSSSDPDCARAGHDHCDCSCRPAQLHWRESENIMQNTAAKQVTLR